MLVPTVLVHVYSRRRENAPSRCAQELPPLRNLLSALVARVHVGSLVTSAFAHRKAGFSEQEKKKGVEGIQDEVGWCMVKDQGGEAQQGWAKTEPKC